MSRIDSPSKPAFVSKPVVSHAATATFDATGWRTFFNYRDLGISAATGGEYDFRIVLAQGGEPVSTGWHYHELHAQIVFCLSGWELIALEDGRIVKMLPGSCLNIPPTYLHNEFAYSPDMQMLVLTRPAEVVTVAVPAPDGWSEESVTAEAPAETTPERLQVSWSWKPVADEF